jgi:hypothetical protein
LKSLVLAMCGYLATPHFKLESWCQPCWRSPWDLRPSVLPHLAYAISLNEDLNFKNSLISDHKLWEHPWSHGMGMSYSSEAIHGYKLLLLSHLHQVLDLCKFHWVRLLVDP